MILNARLQIDVFSPFQFRYGCDSVTDAIRILQLAQQKGEDSYIIVEKSRTVQNVNAQKFGLSGEPFRGLPIHGGR